MSLVGIPITRTSLLLAATGATKAIAPMSINVINVSSNLFIILLSSVLRYVGGFVKGFRMGTILT
jgi:hypothetical protein